MLTIDGERGGGQLLRSSVALSAVTGQPFEMKDIRGARRTPGLRRQHLTAVRAVGEVCGASMEGDQLGRRSLVFRPGRVTRGDYVFDIGTGGSTMLVLHALIPTLLSARGVSHVSVKGGTHNPLAPPFEHLEACYLPQLRKMGGCLEARLLEAGLSREGGGCVTARIEGGLGRPLELLERGAHLDTFAAALISNLPRSIAEREVDVLRRTLSLEAPEAVRAIELEARGSGNLVYAALAFEQVCEVVSALGRIGLPAEKVARDVVRQVRDYLRAPVPVGVHLADQLLLPLALGAGGVYRCGQPSAHLRSHAELLRLFLGECVALRQEGHGVWRVEITGRGALC